MPQADASFAPVTSAMPRVATGLRRVAWVGALCVSAFAISACDESASQAAPPPPDASDLGPSINVNDPKYRGYTRGFLISVPGQKKITIARFTDGKTGAGPWSDAQVKETFTPYCKSRNPNLNPISVTNVAHSPNRTILTFIKCG
ncbi:MAG: hypothetical protein VXW58_18670 [Pseudomonadota bacterium]|nr:hypothetical protein [Pseudomonadota bacterium]